MGAPIPYLLAGQAHLRNASAPPCSWLTRRSWRSLDLPPVCPTISFKEEVMADVYTCSCGNQTWQILETGVRCVMCGTDFVAQHLPVSEFNHMVTEELEEVLEE
jgi:hypothetical protein